MRFYRVYGLDIGSNIELPELDQRLAGPRPDVAITLDPAVDVGKEHGIEVDAGEVRLSVPGVARYTMTGGRSISIEPDRGAATRDIRLYLLGSAIAAILHQRGLLPIHSNAIEVDGRAIAFIGRSGAGKSTMAAWLHDRGHPLLSDDVCVIGRDPEGQPVVHRGVPRLRLWRDALEASGRIAGNEQLATDRADKYTLRAGTAARADAIPLSHFYLLARNDTAPTEISPMSSGEAARALIENSYRGAYVRSLGKVRDHFEQCVALAQSVPMFSLERPWDLTALDPLCDRIEEHARSVANL